MPNLSAPVLQVDVQAPQLFDATDLQLEQFLLLTVVVAGKNATIQQQKLGGMLQALKVRFPCLSPMAALGKLNQDEIEDYLRAYKVGQYARLSRLLTQLSDDIPDGLLNLRTCTSAHLEQYPGIGPKTARFFLLYTRRNYRAAVLDTHVLQWMQANRKALKLPTRVKVPRSTPVGARYAELEAALLRHCDENGLDPAELDFAVWKAGNQNAMAKAKVAA